MKNRKKISVPEETKRPDPDPFRNAPDPKFKRKAANLIQKNFFQEYSNAFHKPLVSGDAHSYFRTTLRDDTEYKILKGLNLESLYLKNKKAAPQSRAETAKKARKGLKEKSAGLKAADTDNLRGSKSEVLVTQEEKQDIQKSPEVEEEDTGYKSRSVENTDTLENFTLVEKMADEEVTDVEEDQEVEVDLDAEGIEDIPEGFEPMEAEGGDIDDEDVQEAERMIEEASAELAQVAEAQKASVSSKEEKFKFDAAIDAAVLQELDDAEQAAKETAKTIQGLKERVAALLQNEKMTESEAKMLEQENKELKAQMLLFEEKTKRIQFLIGQANLFESMAMPKPPLQKRHDEDSLPRVLVCGCADNIPRIVVCNDPRKKVKREQSCPRQPCPPCCVKYEGMDELQLQPQPQQQCSCNQQYPQPQQYQQQMPQPQMQPQMMQPQMMQQQMYQQQQNGGCPPSCRGPGGGSQMMPQMAQRLCESYSMQERLAAENAELEDKRFKLQSDLLNKDQTVDSLQRQLNTLQTELRLVCKENSLLNEKIQQQSHRSRSSTRKSSPDRNMACKPVCPGEVTARLQQFSATTHQLEKQLCEMEQEVRKMQCELSSVQKERQHLEQHRKSLCPPPPCPPCVPCHTCPPPSGCLEQQLKELKEQYSRLQDDFKGKLTEVGQLRADNEKLKQIASNAEESKKSAEEKFKELDKQMKAQKMEKSSANKESLIDQEQQLIVAKQRFREAQDELEELRALIQDQQAQLDDYRNKYLQAQQLVEEQRRQIDMMEMENSRVSEQVNLEIQRVKNQFQEKLQELTPLPDILKATQIKLQEAQQMHLLAERNNEAIVKELQMYKERIGALNAEIDILRMEATTGVDSSTNLACRMQELERQIVDLEEKNNCLKSSLEQAEELAEQNELRVQEKLHEIAQLSSQLECVREESARQVSRTKDRCETIRRSMQNQIADMERQLAQSRAQAKAAQKDRDEIRQKMQAQISNLNENFEDAQMRIRNLQGHVNFLKNSYSNVFPAEEKNDFADACNCGVNY